MQQQLINTLNFLQINYFRTTDENKNYFFIFLHSKMSSLLYAISYQNELLNAIKIQFVIELRKQVKLNFPHHKLIGYFVAENQIFSLERTI